MKIVFFTLSQVEKYSDNSLYGDLLRKFKDEGHDIYIVCPRERRLKLSTSLCNECGVNVLKVKIGNITKTNIIEKGISTILIEYQFKSAIKKYFSNVKFDLVMYSTPPITFAKVIEYIKNRDGAKSYLLLKDIFPQNAVDLKMFSKNGLIYKFFRRKEKFLYKLSDNIGCMSQANVDYLIKHNPYINKNIVHISPNSIEVNNTVKNKYRKIELRNKYSIPLDKKVFVYGGNLGKPQDIPFVIKCLKANEDKADRFFVICGTGTEYLKLQSYINEDKPSNVLLINGLPKEEYEDFIMSCDVGLIFLDHQFTIPNFPSRMLSYMQNSMPVIACTDENTDVGTVITGGNFGWWCESTNEDNFTKVINEACLEDLNTIGQNAKKYLIDNYTVDKSYEIIMDKLLNPISV